MRKTTLLSGTASLPQNLLKKLLLSCFAMVVMLSSYAANISSKAVVGNWNTGASWVGNVVPAAGDNVTIVSGANITYGTPSFAQNGTVTINLGGTLTLTTVLACDGSTVTINGTLNCGLPYGFLQGSSNFVLGNGALANAATLEVADPLGINDCITTTGTQTFSTNAIYVFNGNTNQITGTNLPATIGALTINNTGGAGNNTVTLSNNNTTIRYNGATGILTLTAGILKIGTGNRLSFDNNSGPGNSIINNGGSLATTGLNGSDGGTVIMLNGSGANFNITGTGTTSFYNLSFGIPYSVALGNRTVIQSAASTVIISDTLYMGDNQCKWNTNSPIYTANATLDINNNNQQYIPGTGNRLEWLQLPSGTPGVTKGYPNNVTIANVGTSASNYNTNTYGVKLSGTWSINGTLQVGTPSVAGFVDLDNAGGGTNSFTSGGINIQPGSRLAAPNSSFIVNGNWTRAGTFINNSGTTTFGGSGADTIKVASGTETSFYNLKINGTSTLNVKLNSPVTLGTSNTLTLTSGVVQTDATNILSITNPAITGITVIGTASNTNMINGPVKWTLLNIGTNTYNFPVGSGTAYLPFTLISTNTAAGNVATVQAFAAPSGGVVDATMSTLFPSAYWSLATSANLVAGSTVSVASPATAVAPYILIAKSNGPAATGSTYTSLAGTVGTFGVSNSNNIGTGNTFFITLGAPPIVSTLAATSITTTSVTLNGAFNTGSSKTTSFNYGTSAPAYGTTVNTLLSPINSITATLDSQYVTGLTANTIYHYIATDGTDNGSDVQFITAPNPPVVGPPNTPTTTGFTATWSAPAAMGSAPYTYTIQVSTDPTFASGVTTYTGIASSSTSYTFTTLASATQYYYRVKAVNATASSAWSATSTPISTLVSPTPAGCTTGSGSAGSPGAISKTTVLPVIDGLPDADSIWSSIPPNYLTNLSVGSGTNTQTNWKAMWTTDSLYILIRVEDPTLISQNTGLPNTATVPGATPGTSSNYYDFDGVEITLDPDYSHSSFPPGYDGLNDGQFRFNLGALVPSGQSCGCATQFSGTLFNTVAPHVDYKIAVVPGGYNVEVAIPWGHNAANPGINLITAPSTYGTVTAGKNIGFEVQVNDATSVGGRSAQYSWFNTSSAPYQDPSQFAKAQLLACVQPPIVILPTVTNITADGATLGATVTSAGDVATLISRGTAVTASPDASALANALPEGGTNISTYSGPARTNLTPQTKYYYLGYAINSNNETGVSDTANFYTLSALPTTQPTLFACGANNNLTLTWTSVTFPPTSQATNNGYLILRRQDGTDPTTSGITNRIAVNQGALPSGTTLVATIPSGSTISYIDATAVGGTAYNYLLVPYTWDGVTADSTYNYFITAAPVAAATASSGGSTASVTIDNISSPITLGTQIPLTGHSTIAGNASWTVTPSAPIADTTSLITTSTPTSANTYTYTLIVNAGGCIGSAQRTVTVINEGCLVIPNAFTPNGDGYNDTWIIQSGCYTNLTVDVYNRWGSLMYHSDNYSSATAWDGKYHGEDVPDATYYYVVKATSATSNPIKKGSLTIVR
jgi:gliding motility-associated-like protein